MKNKKIILGSTAFILLALSVGVVLASFTSADSVINKFETGVVDIEVKEEFPEEPPWNNGKVEKKVSIENITTKNDCLVRVTVLPRWIEIVNNEEVAWAGDTNLVELEFANVITDKNENWAQNKWYQADDGYYYYTSKLKANGNTDDETAPILKSVKVNVDLDANPEYKDKVLKVDVNAEAVQPTKQAYLDCWSIQNETVINLLDNALSK